MLDLLDASGYFGYLPAVLGDWSHLPFPNGPAAMLPAAQGSTRQVPHEHPTKRGRPLKKKSIKNGPVAATTTTTTTTTATTTTTTTSFHDVSINHMFYALRLLGIRHEESSSDFTGLEFLIQSSDDGRDHPEQRHSAWKSHTTSLDWG